MTPEQCAEAVAEVLAIAADQRRIELEIFDKRVKEAFEHGEIQGRAEEREACARLAEGELDATDHCVQTEIARAIRARSTAVVPSSTTPHP